MRLCCAVVAIILTLISSELPTRSMYDGAILRTRHHGYAVRRLEEPTTGR
jgi:hypothetical protein